MLFRELLQEVEVRSTEGDLNTTVTGIAYDSRRVEPGFLFVAVEGFATDGHKYVNQAVQQGAAAVVIQRETQIPLGTAWARVDNTRSALALLSACFYGKPSGRMKVIGVTGTNGKTTTANLLAAVFAASGQKVGLIGTIHNRIGDRILPVKHTTPESADLQQLLREMADKGVETCIMEVSSHALTLHRVDGCEFDIAIFTNLTQDHLDFHGNMEEYLAAKLRLFSGLGAAAKKTDPKYAVINADDPSAKRFIEASGGDVYTYGLGENVDVRAEDILVNSGGVSFNVLGNLGSYQLKLHLTGRFNVYNALGAFSAAAVSGVPGAVIKQALESVRGIPGRFELVEGGQDFAVIVDYAHTPDGLENILKTARQIAKGRLITVFGCGGDRDRTKRPLMGSIAASYSDFAVVTSDNPRTEDPLTIITEIEEGIRQAGANNNYTREPDRRSAIRLALEMARTGDVVVIAGKGHEDYQIIGKQRFTFDDHREALAALEKLRSGEKDGSFRV